MNEPNGVPHLFVDNKDSLDLKTLFPVGKEVLLNARKVKSDMIDLQATVVWPKKTEAPKYKLKPSKLDEDLKKFHDDCRLDKLVPICINGLPPVGSLNIWSAKVKEIVDDDHGIIEVICDPRDGKKEFSLRFNCFFHKSDLWLENGINVGENQFYNSSPLHQLVSLYQPVDLVSRSIIREKGQFMKKSTSSVLEMQALCVSLKPSSVPRSAPRGSKIVGGPGAFGGCNRGETPYMFQIGLSQKLNISLLKFLKVFSVKNTTVCNLDPDLLETSIPEAETEVEVTKKVHKITPAEEELAETKPKVLAELVSHVEAVIVEAPDDQGFGVVESCQGDWKAIFHFEMDGVLFTGVDDVKVGSEVCVNANLIDASLDIQYIASCVWKKSETVLHLPNMIEKKLIKSSKIDMYHQFNLRLSEDKFKNVPKYMKLKTGTIAKILDDNYGIINHEGKFILFDTCDFWVSAQKTAARDNLKLDSLVSVGDLVSFYAVLINPRSTIPYLATSVWTDKSVKTVKIHREKVHPDKIKIYQTVSSCSPVVEELLSIKKEFSSSTNQSLSNVAGVVKFGIHLARDSFPSAGLVEMSDSSGGVVRALFLISACEEVHERYLVCVPGREVVFSAVPVSPDLSPVTHIVTSISCVHQTLSHDQPGQQQIITNTTRILTKIKTEHSLTEFSRSDQVMLYFSVISRSSVVVDCAPSGRLVCMIDKRCGILETQDRELAYFEMRDTNLPSSLSVKQAVEVMARCRDVGIRFQASRALSGPVKLIVHDGSVAISSNLDKYHPEIKLKQPNVKLGPRSFSKDKLERAKVAVEVYKNNKILSIEKVLQFSADRKEDEVDSSSGSHDVEENPDNSNHCIESKEKKFKFNEEQKSMKSIQNVEGKLKSILNENFGLIEFVSPDGKMSCFCLFDTFDLYLDHLRPAAMKNITVDKFLVSGETLRFNAYEVCPSNMVAWLANGVWKESCATVPDPVPFNKISKDKIAVFSKVAETCSVLIGKETSEAGSCLENKTSELEQESTPAEEILELEVTDLEVIPGKNFETGIFRLQFNGEKIKMLAHSSRVWLWNHPMKPTDEEWQLLAKSQSFRIKALKTSGEGDYDYMVNTKLSIFHLFNLFLQVQFAHAVGETDSSDEDV